MPAALVDAGPLVALFGANQPRASHYRNLLQQAAHELWSLATTWPCVTEASHLLDVPERYTLLRWIAASGITVFPFAQDDLEDMVVLMRRYTESPHTEIQHVGQHGRPSAFRRFAAQFSAGRRLPPTLTLTGCLGPSRVSEQSPSGWSHRL